MATAPRTFRVFVSSTFSDLKAEREALQRDVWPALAALCAQHGARFQAIDLRWGVSAEAGLDQQTMAICLGEIDRCREVSPKPNFIVLLGDRYGWRPIPATIPATEMELLLGTIGDPGLRELVARALIWPETGGFNQSGWYRLDENAVPPEYVLLPRVQQPPPSTSEQLAELSPAVLATFAALRQEIADVLPAIRTELEAVPLLTTESGIDAAIAGLASSWEPLHALYGRLRQLTGRLSDLDGHPGLPADEDDALAESEYADLAEAERQIWERLEASMLLLLAAMATSAPLEAAARLKYGASATEQEIWRGALRVADAPSHVHCFFRHIDGLPDAVAPLPASSLARQFCDYAPDGSPMPATLGLPAPVEALRALEHQLTAQVPDNIHRISGVRWLQGSVPDSQLRNLDDGSVSPISLDHLDAFCLEVFRSLADTILREIAAQEQIDPLLAEVRAHDTFRHQRAEGFLGRADLLARIATDLADSAIRQPLLIHGRSGSGKSALLARALTDAWEARGRPSGLHPDNLELARGDTGAVEIARFIGVTPDSSDGRALLQSLCQQLAFAFGDDGAVAAVPADFNGLVTDFRERIASAGERVSAERPLLIFLDALDQLSDADNARALFWLPTDLPQHVHIVVSAISDQDSSDSSEGDSAASSAVPRGDMAAPDCFRALARRLPAERLRRVEPLAEGEADALLSQWLAGVGRTLDGGRSRSEAPRGQRNEILRHEQGRGLPIYLQVAFQEARRWRSFVEPVDPDTPAREAAPPGRVRLAENAAGMIRDLFDRLSEDGEHGPLLVERSLALLAAARSGLAEDELLQLLSPIPDPSLTPAKLQDDATWAGLLARPDAAVLRDYHRRAPRSPRVASLPVVVWSRLALDLRPYLTERTADGASLFSFYHRQFREVVEEEYLKPNDGQDGRDRHAELAAFFLRERPAPPEVLDGSLAARLSEVVAEIEKRVWPERKGDQQRGGPTAGIGVTAHAAELVALANANLRKLAELPFQQTLADDWDGTFATLTDFTFLEQKASTGGQTHRDANGRETTTYTGVFDLQADYQRALDRWPRGADEDDPDGPGPIIVTATDFHDGDGYRIRCPICLVRYPLDETWLGQVMRCPGTGSDGRPCRGRWRVNSFTAPPRPAP